MNVRRLLSTQQSILNTILCPPSEITLFWLGDVLNHNYSLCSISFVQTQSKVPHLRISIRLYHLAQTHQTLPLRLEHRTVHLTDDRSSRLPFSPSCFFLRALHRGIFKVTSVSDTHRRIQGEDDRPLTTRNTTAVVYTMRACWPL